MSPVDPSPSPISPITALSYEMSPTTPNSLLGNFFLHSPTPLTPIIEPLLHLPKLTTCFDISTSHLNRKRPSVDFHLPTPSPLRLDQSPLSAKLATCLHTQLNGGDESPPYISRESALTNTGCDVQCSPIAPSGSPLADAELRMTPRLRREDAMEGLEQVGAFTEGMPRKQSINLPLRITTSRTSPSTPPPWLIEDNTTATSTSRSSARPRLPISKTGRNMFRSCSPPITTTSAATSRSPSPSVPSAKSYAHQRHSAGRIGSAGCHTHRIHRRRASRPPSSRSSFHHHNSSCPRLVIQPASPHPLFRSINHLRTPLVPLISVLTGLPHPQFPLSLLQYHLLTHDQLDSLARWYHQTIDAGHERWMYPAPIESGKAWVVSTGASVSGPVEYATLNTDLEAKRRRWGRFIGLRGCESPVERNEDGDVGPSTNGDSEEDELAQRMDREWRDALRRAEEEERVREKIWRGRF